MPDLNQQIEDVINKRINYIDTSLGASWSEMAAIQKELTVLIIKTDDLSTRRGLAERLRSSQVNPAMCIRELSL